MSMITRRSLFGLSVGAVAAVKMPTVKAEPVVVGLDFGRQPSAIVFGRASEVYAEAVRIMSRAATFKIPSGHV